MVDEPNSLQKARGGGAHFVIAPSFSMHNSRSHFYLLGALPRVIPFWALESSALNALGTWPPTTPAGRRSCARMALSSSRPLCVSRLSSQRTMGTKGTILMSHFSEAVALYVAHYSPFRMVYMISSLEGDM